MSEARIIENSMPKKTVTHIAAKPQVPTKKKVAAYARVSCGKDEMLHSLAAQISHYSGLIQQRRDWSYAGVFADKAETGTKDTRPNFQKMLAACRNGEIDMILTKSVSRFARNTVTLLSTVRKLKSLGIDVYFEEQNIHSISSEGELMLTLIAAIAQEESRAVSENCKWRIRKNFERGLLPPFRINGYEVKNGQLQIIPHEAETVRLIFQMYLSGMGYDAICRTLNELDIPTKQGGIWRSFTVSEILNNEKYKGELLLQKYFRTDHLTKKEVRNRGEIQRFYVENAHAAIIDGNTFERAQEERSRRRAATPATSRQPHQIYPFTGKIICGNCGKHYKRRMNHEIACWQCCTYMEFGRKHCPAKQIHEDILMKESVRALGMENFGARGFAQAFEERIREIRVHSENRLRFVFADGTEVETQWSNPSRRDSWTSEMKEDARQRAIRQNMSNL